MKKLLKNIFVIAFGALAMVSCSNDNDPNDGHFISDNQSGWLQFPKQNTTYVVSGLATEFTVEVSLMAPINTDGLSFGYVVEDVQGSSAGYLSYSGTGVVPKNSRTGYINFSIPNTELTTCREFTVRLTNTSRANVQIGLNNATEKPVTHTILIGKGVSTYIGNYSVLEGTYQYQTQIIAGDEDNEIVIRKFSDFNPASLTSVFFVPVSVDYALVEFGPRNTFLFTDATAGDIFVGDPGHDVGPGADQESLEEHLRLHSSTYNPCTNGLSIYFGLFDAAGSPQQELRDVFTKL